MSSIPGWEGAIGPFPGQYTEPHVYARDVHSGAGNCVCGFDPYAKRHVQLIPGLPNPALEKNQRHPAPSTPEKGTT